MGLRTMCRTCTCFARRGYVQMSGNINRNIRLNTRCAVKICTNWPNITQRSNYSNDLPSKCWKCNFPKKSELFCSKCRVLQELPDKLNYFDVIGVKQTYDIENAEIQKKYRQLQNLLHPDRFSNSSEKEKELSDNLSALVNKAYSILTHPLDRGLYMLELNDLEIPEGTTSLNPEFLLEIMEKNEEVETSANNVEKVLKLMKENRQVLQNYSREVSEAFQQKDIEKAKTILIKMKYYASIDEKLKKRKEDLGIVE